MAAIVGDLSLKMPDGTVLRDSTDLGLAWKWAAHTLGADWPDLSYSEKCDHVAGALAALRKAVQS